MMIADRLECVSRQIRAAREQSHARSIRGYRSRPLKWNALRPELRPRRSRSACEHYAVRRHCQSSEHCHYPCCSCKEQFTPSPPIRESRIYDDSSVHVENDSFENNSRDGFGPRDKAELVKPNAIDSKPSVKPPVSLEPKVQVTPESLTKSNKLQPMSSSELKSSSSEKVTSSGSDDTLVDAPQYSSRDSNIGNTVLDSTAKLSEPNKRSCQKNQSVNLDKSDSSTSSPTFLRNSKIDGSTDTYAKNSVPKSSSLLRQSLNCQNRTELNRSDTDLRQSPQPSRTPRIVSMIPSGSNGDKSYSRHANSSNSSENKNLYQTFTNQYVNSPGSQRHVRINPADLLEYDKRDSRPHSRQDDRNIFKESPVCYRKTKDNSHADQLNELKQANDQVSLLQS
ncbi:hypothetical protein WDU94_012677 [Cyamophila willieti]